MVSLLKIFNLNLGGLAKDGCCFYLVPVHRKFLNSQASYFFHLKYNLMTIYLHIFLFPDKNTQINTSLRKQTVAFTIYYFSRRCIYLYIQTI